MSSYSQMQLHVILGGYLKGLRPKRALRLPRHKRDHAQSEAGIASDRNQPVGAAEQGPRASSSPRRRGLVDLDG